jgi:hypothetical protein
VTSGSGGAVRLATAAPPFSVMVSSGERDPPNGFAREEVSVWLGREPSSGGEGHGEITGKRSRTRSNRSPSWLLCQAPAENGGDHGLRISLEIHHDRVYEPYARHKVGTDWRKRR